MEERSLARSPFELAVHNRRDLEAASGLGHQHVDQVDAAEAPQRCSV
jgi:hypothetical protein